MKNTAKIIVSTSSFENSHGKKPRGFGVWCFTCDDLPGTMLQARGTLQAACKDAKAQLRALVPSDYNDPVFLDVAP
jgi:hypothetical protein